MIGIIKDLSNNKTVLELLWGQNPLLLFELANPTDLQLDGVGVDFVFRLASKFAPFLPNPAPFSGDFFCTPWGPRVGPKDRDGHHVSA